MLASRLRSLRPVSFLVGAGLVAYAGCSSSASTADSVTHPTMIAVSPEAFLGDLPCATSGAGLKRYVATLFDTNDTGEGGATAEDLDTQEHRQGEPGADQFQLPSSTPTPCSAAVGFGYVVAGRHYQVRVDGYDTDDIAPRALGARQMVRKSDGESLLAPRWHAECYRAIAVDSTIVQADRCEVPFVAGEDAVTSLRVPLAPLLGSFGCGSEAGQVAQLRVTVDVFGQGAEPEQSFEQTVPCAPGAEALFENLTPTRRVSAYVAALPAGAGAIPVAGATCDAVTVKGAVTDARCGRLSSVGTLRVDLKAALTQLGLTCSSASVSAVQINVPGAEQPFDFPPPDCLQPFERGFPAGPAAVTVSATTGAGDSSTLTCHGEIEPGKLTLAECDLATQ